MSWRENACGLWDRVPRILDPGANEARISDYPFIIPPQFSHYPVTIWRRRSESHCVTASFQSSQPPCKSINYARSPVKSGFQRSLRKSRTILPKFFHHPSTLLRVSIYRSFYWRSAARRGLYSRIEHLLRAAAEPLAQNVLAFRLGNTAHVLGVTDTHLLVEGG